MTTDTIVTSTTQTTLRPGWRTVRFGDVVRDVKVTVVPEESGLERYIAGEHMDTDDLHIRRWGTIGDGYLGPAFHRKFVAGQVLYGSRRTYLRKVALADFDGICANTTFVLEPMNGDLIPELLPFIMQTESFVKHSMQQSRGSTNPYVTFKDLAWYEFALPPREEQRRIAEILWAVEEAAESYYEVVQQLEAFLKVAFEKYISRSERIQGKDVWTTLGEAIVGIVAGKSPSSSSVPASATEYGVLKVSAVGEQGFVEEENKALLNQQDFNLEYEVKPHFLLVTRANALLSGVGRACIVHETRPGLMLSDKTLRLVVNTKLTSNRFLLQSLRSPRARRHIELSLNGTDAKNISQEKLRETPIPLPPKNLQDEICRFLINQDQAIVATTRQIGQHRRLKTCLLEQLLSGQEV